MKVPIPCLIVSLVVTLLQSSVNGESVNSTNSSSECRCDVAEIYSRIPFIVKAFSEDDRFSWVFKGKEGPRGPDGPEGPVGMPGRPGMKGDFGDRGYPGPPGEVVYGMGEKGDKGDRGYPGRDGTRGSKGEPGVPYHAYLRPGSYIEMKGEKGDPGRRGRRGLRGDRGAPGVSMEGPKGEKGEPAVIPDLELIRGPQGLRGPPGLSGRPGLCCGGRGTLTGEESKGPFIVPVPGSPGLSIQGEKGERGEKGAPGKAPDMVLVPGAHVFKTETDMRLVRSKPGTIIYIEEDERVFIRVKNGWKEMMLGVLRLDRPDPSGRYPIAEGQRFEPEHRHDLNDVEEKPYYRERIRNDPYAKKRRHEGNNRYF